MAEAPHTGINAVADGGTFYIDGNNLVLTASKASTVMVYSIDGRVVFDGTLLPRHSLWLESGIYAVVVDGKASKVVVK